MDGRDPLGGAVDARVEKRRPADLEANLGTERLGGKSCAELRQRLVHLDEAATHADRERADAELQPERAVAAAAQDPGGSDRRMTGELELAPGGEDPHSVVAVLL